MSKLEKIMDYEPNKKDREDKVSIVLAFYTFARAMNIKEKDRIEAQAVKNIMDLTTKNK